MWRDIRYGLRGLLREPTFAITAILTIALGTATTTTVFSVVDAELWRPLPYPKPDRLLAIYSRDAAGQGPVDRISGPDLQAWRASAPALVSFAAQALTNRRILRLDTAESVIVGAVTPNYFETIGQVAAVGRVFSVADASLGGRAVLTDRVWRRLFGGDPSVIGRPVTINDETFVVTGVLKPDDPISTYEEVYVSIDESSPAFLDGKGLTFPGGIGRLRPGVDPGVAREQLQAVVSQLNAGAKVPRYLFAEDLRESFTGFNSRPLFFFLGASLIVLLLSAVNVGTLLIARAFRRTREFALRGALGGGEGALVRQLLVEGALVAVPGALVAILITLWSAGLFTSELPSDFFARSNTIPIDFRVFGFAFAVTGLVTAVFALAPLLSARRLRLASALGPGARTGRSAAEGRSRDWLLAAQIALTVVLLAGAGIFLKSFAWLTRVPLGFNPENVAALRAAPVGPRFSEPGAARAYATDLLAAVRAVPGVSQAAVGTDSPLGSGPMANLIAAGTPRPEQLGQAPRAIMRSVGPDYFKALGIRVARGREFSAADVPGSPRVVILNETSARELFAREEPLGRVIDVVRAGSRDLNQPDVIGQHLVVGVAVDVKNVGFNEVEFGNVYFPFAQVPSTRVEIVVRSATPAAGLVESLRKAAATVDRAVPITSAGTLDTRVDNALREDRFNLLLISAFALVAIVLAGVGIYGAVAYHVQSRTRELGVRLALGARPQRLVGAAPGSAQRHRRIGGAAGLAATVGLARLIGNALYLVRGEHNGLIYGVTTTDPQALAGAVAGMLLIVLLAGVVPARRVARVDPVLALRNE
jgi:putative ABC transport system permease protein